MADELLTLASTQNNNARAIDYSADTLIYKKNQQLITLKGNAKLDISPDNIHIEADIIDYYSAEQKFIATGHVVIINKDQVSYASLFTIDFETQDINLADVTTDIQEFNIQADSARVYKTDRFQRGSYVDGKVDFDQSFNLSTIKMLGLENTNNDHLLSSFNSTKDIKDDERHFQLEANYIKYTDDRIQNNIFVSRPRIRLKKSNLRIPLPSLFLTGGESSQQMFTPIFGNNPQTGAGDFNLGVLTSVVVGKPENEHAIHFGPFAQFGSNLGGGLMAGYTTPKLDALVAYGSAKDRGLAEIQYALTDNINLVYGRNSYLGGGITSHLFQIKDNRALKIPFIGRVLEDESINIATDLSGVEDSQLLRNQENNIISNLQNSITTNSSTQWVGRAQNVISARTKPIIKVGTDSNNVKVNLWGALMSRAYTTGDVTMLGSVQPSVAATIKNRVFATVGYNHTERFNNETSPVGFDQIIQGNSSVFLDSHVKITDWLSAGTHIFYSLSRDEFISQESRIILGPKDFKLMLGYDPVFKRFRAGFNIDFAGPFYFNRMTYEKSNKSRRPQPIKIGK